MQLREWYYVEVDSLHDWALFGRSTNNNTIQPNTAHLLASSTSQRKREAVLIGVDPFNYSAVAPTPINWIDFGLLLISNWLDPIEFLQMSGRRKNRNNAPSATSDNWVRGEAWHLQVHSRDARLACAAKQWLTVFSFFFVVVLWSHPCHLGWRIDLGCWCNCSWCYVLFGWKGRCQLIWHSHRFRSPITKRGWTSVRYWRSRHAVPFVDDVAFTLLGTWGSDRVILLIEYHRIPIAITRNDSQIILLIAASRRERASRSE